jgi:hypothetical protein
MKMDKHNTTPRDWSAIWRRRIGLLAVLVTLVLIPVVARIGVYLHDDIRSLKDPVVLPFTPALISAGRLLNDFWFVAVGVVLGSYWFWFSKNERRLLWFNAVISVAFPLALWGVIRLCLQQNLAIIEMLQKK